MKKMTNTQRAEILAFLSKHTTFTLATLDQNAQPQAASLFYVSDEALHLYWISDEKSKHSQNLERFGRIAATIHNETWNWRDIQGLQINGEARRLVAADEKDRAMMLFRKKFPFVGKFVTTIAQSSFYVCSPTWIRWIDNGRGFGHREEFTFS